LLSIGIMADIVPNTAKHRANAPVAKTSWNLDDEFSCTNILPGYVEVPPLR
jgi:hypothetical protein